MRGADPNSPAELLREGELLADGKYEVQNLVGAGGMGQVYRARHTMLRRTVAIKVLHPGLTADPKVEARFLREARATSLLEHRNSMQVLDFGSEKRADGSRLLYIVMEYIEGRELSDIVRSEGPLAVERIADLASQVCAALFQAHEQGVIHRDLKPENIMILDHVDDDGRQVERVKVCDFGIAKIQSNEEYDSGKGSKLTEAGEVFGTPYYMSPEQARGQRLDARSDIYSLGVVLFELATGALPFVGENIMGVLAQQITDPPPRPSTVRPDLDPDLERIVLQCLEKDPELRYQNVRDLRAELRDLVGGRPYPLPSALEHVSETAPTVRASTPAASIGSAAGIATAVRPGTPGGGSPARSGRGALWIALAVLVVGGGAVGTYVYLESRTEQPGGSATVAGAAGPRTPSRMNPGFPTASPPDAASPEPAPEPPTDEDGTAAVADAAVASPVETEPDHDPAGEKAGGGGKRKRRSKELSDEVAAPVPEPAPEPAPEPRPAPEPAVAPQPPEKPAEPAPAPKPAPVLDAAVQVSVTDVKGSLPQGPVRQGVQRVADDYRVCYRQAAKKAGRDWAGSVNVSFTLDVDGRARSPSAVGGGLPGLDACVRTASARIRSSTRPDTGTVAVKVAVRFTPRD